MRFITTTLLLLFVATLSAQQPLTYRVETQAAVGLGNHAPYFFVTNQHGITSMERNSGYLQASLTRNVEVGRKWSIGYGADLVASYNNSYALRVQQLYADINYGWFSLMAGSKEMGGVFKSELSSGGFIWSGNASPIPQLRIGFNQFHPIPFTNNWVSMWGDVAYGYFMDSPWMENTYSYNRHFLTTGAWYHQKRLFFRTKQDMPLVVTVGGEFATQFGGDHRYYMDGVLQEETLSALSLRDFLQVLIPNSGESGTSVGDQNYFYGNHLGAWHFVADYKLSQKEQLSAYFEWMFEDGSGIGKLNGLDGLWGISYQGDRSSWLSHCVVEYLQTTNQGGPIHWAPNDKPGTEMTTQATGADDYYNNYCYNGWAHYGRANGNALLRSPIYNNDGVLYFQYSRVRAAHVALEGALSKECRYTLRYCYDTSWGTPYIPRPRLSSHSVMAEVVYSPKQWQGWSIGGSLAGDSGELFGTNGGVSISLKKQGIIR